MIDSTLITIWCVWLASIALSGVIARIKSRSAIIWCLLSIFLGPFATLMVLLKSTYRSRDYVEAEVAEAADIQLNTGDTVYGLRAEIEIRETGIEIKRSAGVQNVLLHGVKADKRIAYRSITAVQLRMPTNSMSGYIQFSLLGAIESQGGILDATTDENSVMFVLDQMKPMLALRDHIERKIDAAHNPQAAVQQISIAEELTKFADLRDRGILTEAEFDAKKTALLS